MKEAWMLSMNGPQRAIRRDMPPSPLRLFLCHRDTFTSIQTPHFTLRTSCA